MPGPRLLIITAAFGEGHNSAARNLGLAFKQAGATPGVEDPCMLSAPWLTRRLEAVYRYITTHYPEVWARIYRSTDRCDFNRQPIPFLFLAERKLQRLIEEFRPDAVISTYPIYPYCLKRIAERTGKRLPVITVVTDSIEINTSWLKAPTDRWLVTDAFTKEVMIAKGAPAAHVVETGFPVHPGFATLQPVCRECGCDPFRILYFPTARRPFVRRHCRALLEASPHVKITVILGRNVRLLYRRAREIQRAYPGRVRLIGWTKRVPELLNEHHLVVGKAGGATVHEAIAARCPMLIHHLVPGQEEGNLALLEKLGAGGLAETPEALQEKVRAMLDHEAAGWRAMKSSLIRHRHSNGSDVAAEAVLRFLNPS